MSSLTEKAQEERLKRSGLNIRTEYWDEHSVRVRCSDRSRRDNVRSGNILKKEYCRNGRPVRKETRFSPMMMFTFISQEDPEQDMTCPNCGTGGKLKDFGEGCPCCGTGMFVEYSNHQLAGKYTAGKKAAGTRLYLAVLLSLLILCLTGSFLIIGATGRTFMTFDILKSVVYGVLSALILFFAFYMVRAFWITEEAERDYQRQQRMLADFETGLAGLRLELGSFYTNLCCELNDLFFGDDPVYRDIVDWDILRYGSCTVERDAQGHRQPRAEFTLRLIREKNGRLYSSEYQVTVLMAWSGGGSRLKPGINILKCRSCGNPIDPHQSACTRCGTRYHYKQPLYLKEITGLPFADDTHITNE